MAANSIPTIVLGAGNIGDTSIDSMARFDTPEQVTEFMQAFFDRGYNHIDTAANYSPGAPGSSESRIGAVELRKKFVIDTKVNSNDDGCHKKELIEKNVNTSIAGLKIPKIHIEYLHRPDRQTPFEETCEGINKSYEEGKFEKFGLSNYTAAEVEQLVEICERRGFVKPTVYQGQYNPIVRSGEEALFPVLRKHGIAFYAWSPAAGGFFAGNHKDVKEGGGARFDQSHMLGKLYTAMYQKPSIEAATDKALEIAKKHKIGGHAAALRWTVYHSTLKQHHGDGVIIGASSVPQLISNLDMIEQGPLPEDAVDALEALHKEIADTQIPYHF